MTMGWPTLERWPPSRFMKNTTRVIGQRLQVFQEALTKEIQDGLKRNDGLA